MLNMFEVLGKCSFVGGDKGIDTIVPGTISTVVNIIKIAVPILLIIFGILDLAKAVMSNDDKEMKGAQTKLIKRCIYAVAVFFVVALVQFIFAQLGKADENNTNGTDNASDISGCIDCFINGNCEGDTPES